MEPPPAFTSLAADFEEAIRVSLARKGRPTSGVELRAELPAVYREMIFLRQGSKRVINKSSFKDYSLLKLTTELVALVRADENIAGDRAFRLEAAVIENAGNPKKALFVPKNLAEGFGEGMYHQAIVLRHVS